MTIFPDIERCNVIISRAMPLEKYLTREEKQQFYNEGYLLVKNVVDPELLNKARQWFEDAFNQGLWKNSPFDSEGILNGIYDRFPELVPMLYTKKYFAILKELLGEDLVFLPECAVHRNRFFDWHKDTTSQEAAGLSFHQPAENVLVQVAIYFQSNTKAGGGLTLIPGTQLQPDHFTEIYYGNFWQRNLHRIAKKLKLSYFDNLNKHPRCYDIPNELGDLLVFDLRVDHRSTFPQKGVKQPQDKFAIFNTAGAKNSPAKLYQNYLRKRPEPYYRLLAQSIIPQILVEHTKKLHVKLYY